MGSGDPPTKRPAKKTTVLSYFLALAVFVVGGIPMVAYLWGTLNQILALHPEPKRLLLSVPVLLVFAGLLIFLGRKARQL
jgi:hypothetical protein